VTTKADQRLLKLAIISTLALITAVLIVPAYADATANLAVSAEVNASCTISTTDLSFGTYDGIFAHASQHLTETATVTTNCTAGSIVVITMGGGVYPAWRRPRGIIRSMKNEGSNSYLKYDIYADAGHTFQWNYDQVRMSSVTGAVGNGAPQEMTIYGKVFKNQKDAAVGSYTDTVSIGVNY
jgi:spore coat protein U-like protein